MLPLSVIGWILIGGLAGWLAARLMKRTDSLGLLLNVVVGVIGGLVGGFILKFFGVNVDEAGWGFSFLTCLGGACLLIWLMSLVNSKQRN
ncbi:MULTISPECIES: GlsB/YeaQ/YmgE family stress response membrane protein [unclassified Gordonia (in: high G+C Gram-positive bacteria)]|uniref:GlsB/YeaQ/YmgE family stress response membrane protein n=1 Tax=unclassified Gordonia (in: high G+C Gram-positive bacteria) TaxID=2657482 RepID=UPI001FFEFE4D|nr:MULTISPECIES: GlsB/YeaQ/YmgE family stress response membrane protein [unclassified Gordonia (in: high G+C Gram-positive bacteria)]UQE74325.1 GlsB/YeaQ/YmgE family stress response membrane protein [Gordonia sp. PP30]